MSNNSSRSDLYNPKKIRIRIRIRASKRGAKGLELALLEAQLTAPCALRPALLCCMIRTVKQVAWGCSDSARVECGEKPRFLRCVASGFCMQNPTRLRIQGRGVML